MTTPASHKLDYVNHRGERATRAVVPRRVWHGATDWHDSDQWLLEGFDEERQAVRNYSLREVVHWDSPHSIIPTGIYRHFKGGIYLVLGTLLDSESSTDLVRYRELSGEFREWVRPLDMFLEHVVQAGVETPRFVLIEQL